MRVQSLLLTILFAAVATTPAAAHDLWLGTMEGPHGPEVVVRYGHPGKFEGAATAKLLELSARSPDGSGRDLTVAAEPVDGSPAFVAPLPSGKDGTLVSATYDNGFWTRLPDGAYRNAAKPMVPGGRDSQWSVKFGKALTGAGAPFETTVGHTLEIVPLSDPYAGGTEMRVQVLFKGKPLADVEIKQLGDLAARDGAKAVGRTDANGVLTISHKPGRDFLAVSHKVPSGQPELADSDAFSATLSITGQSLTQ